MSYQGHAWTWHSRVPAWRICRDCLTERRPGPVVGEYLYRLDGETQFQAEEPVCPGSPAAQMAAAKVPTLFDGLEDGDEAQA